MLVRRRTRACVLQSSARDGNGISQRNQRSTLESCFSVGDDVCCRWPLDADIHPRARIGTQSTNFPELHVRLLLCSMYKDRYSKFSHWNNIKLELSLYTPLRLQTFKRKEPNMQRQRRHMANKQIGHAIFACESEGKRASILTLPATGQSSCQFRYGQSDA